MNLFYSFTRWIVKGVVAITYRHRTHGRKSIPRGAAIIAPNHASHLDPMLVACSWPRKLHFLARDTLFSDGFFGWYLRKIQVHPVTRGEADIKAMKKILELLAKGKQVVLFPEGTRSRDGKLGEGQAGVAMLAMRAGCPVIPVYVDGTFDLMPHGGRPKLFGKTSCSIGSPIDPKGYADLPRKEGQRKMTDDLMAAIGALRPNKK